MTGAVHELIAQARAWTGSSAATLLSYLADELEAAEARAAEHEAAAIEFCAAADAAEAREKQRRLEAIEGVLDLLGQAHVHPDEVPTDAITMHVGGQGHGWLIAVDQIGTAPLSAEEILARIDARPPMQEKALNLARAVLAAGGENPADSEPPYQGQGPWRAGGYPADSKERAKPEPRKRYDLWPQTGCFDTEPVRGPVPEDRS